MSSSETKKTENVIASEASDAVGNVSPVGGGSSENGELTDGTGKGMSRSISDSTLRRNNLTLPLPNILSLMHLKVSKSLSLISIEVA